MDSNRYTQFTLSTRKGIKGEAFFETLLTEYCIPHRIAGPKDVGIDYICEWANGDKPTGILFATQVKTFSENSAHPKPLDTQDQNGLDLYEIRYSKLLHIKPETCQYWKGLGIPVYLFAIVQKATNDMVCYYKRYTPFLTSARQKREFKYYDGFCKVSEGTSFIAFKYPNERQLGFARDLYIDYMRCCYSKGSIAYLNPADVGLNQFTHDNVNMEKAVFEDLFEEYAEQIYNAYNKTREYLARREKRFLDKDRKALDSNSSLYCLATGCIDEGDTQGMQPQEESQTESVSLIDSESRRRFPRLLSDVLRGSISPDESE
jgi:hypothetical protein